jgi:gluconolactonase
MMITFHAISPAAHDLLDLAQPGERIATGFRFTEGPVWDAATGSLLFSDIPADRLYRWHPGTGPEIVREPSDKSNGLTWDLQGRLLACEHLGRRVSRTLADGSVETVADSYQGRRLNSPNDLVMRSDGTLYFSDPPYGIQSADFGAIREQEQPLTGLYMLPPGAREPVLVGDDFDRPNGLAFSSDERRLYVADTPRYHLRMFEVEADGRLSGGGTFVEFDREAGEGRPDGLKVDLQGNLYSTGPGGLWIVSPTGEILARAAFPEKTANCAWGDDDLQTLYVTASTSIYRLRTRTPGCPVRHQQST